MGDFEGNKKIAKLFIESLGDGNDIDATTLMTEDALFHQMFRSRGLPLAPQMTRDELHAAQAGPMRGIFKNGQTLTVNGVIAEGDVVAVEAESFADLGNGRIYNNLYHFLVTVKDGKVTSVKEYADYLHAHQVLFS